MEVENDQDEDLNNWGQIEIRYAHCICQIVIHDVDIFGESIGNSSKWCGIKKPHCCPQDLSYSILQHHL